MMLMLQNQRSAAVAIVWHPQINVGAKKVQVENLSKTTFIFHIWHRAKRAAAAAKG